MNQEFAKNWLSSWTGNRPQELLEFYHEDIYYQDPAFPSGIQGKENLGKYLTKLLAKNPDWIWELDSLYESDKFTFVKWKATINGKIVTGLDLIQMKDGKILRNEVYFDPSILLTKSSS